MAAGRRPLGFWPMARALGSWQLACGPIGLLACGRYARLYARCPWPSGLWPDGSGAPGLGACWPRAPGLLYAAAQRIEVARVALQVQGYEHDLREARHRFVALQFAHAALLDARGRAQPLLVPALALAALHNAGADIGWQGLVHGHERLHQTYPAA